MAGYPTTITAASGAVFASATWNASPAAVDAWMRNPPQALLQQTVAQSIPNSNSTVTVSFDTTLRDNYSGHQMVATGDAYVAQAPGVYHVTGMLNLAWNGAGAPAGAVVNPSLITRTAEWAQLWILASPPPVRFQQSLSALIPMAVGDYVQLQVWQTSGAAQPTGFVTCGSRMSVRWIGL